MDFLDMKKKELLKYKPTLTRENDFDEFWQKTIEVTNKVPLNHQKRKIDYPSSHVKVYSISYNGFDDTRIHGWFIVPGFFKRDEYPCLVHYHGYTGNKGMPSDYMQWIMMGVAVLAVDCRDQSGETGNKANYTGGYTQSVACKGILDKDEYYFRAVYMDCKKAIDFACQQPEVNQERIIIEGGSQGGALGMAVSALDDRPYLAMVDVPSNSNLEERVKGEHGAFAAVTDYLKKYPDRMEQVFKTLSYFDTMNMADKISCKVLASVGLKDNVCPAKYYFATYNRIKAKKEINIYPFNGHEGGGGHHNMIKLNYLLKNLGKDI